MLSRAACSAGATAAAVLLLLATADAAAPMVKTQAPGYYRMMLGDFEVTSLLDGTAAMPVSQYLNGVTPEQVRGALAREYLREPLELSVNAFLINTGSKLVLIDTGDAGDMGGTGRLLANLEAAGYHPGQVDEIYITHMHGDHISGLTRDGQRQFPNAVVRAGRAEGEYWLSEAQMAAAPAEARESFKHARDMLEPYVSAGRYSPIDGDAELVPGVRAIATHGHTPGHTCYLVESHGQRLLLIGDLVHVEPLQFRNPAITLKFDTDTKAALAQRLRIFREAAHNGEWIGAAHMPFPGLGHIRAEGKGFAWVPANYTLVR